MTEHVWHRRPAPSDPDVSHRRRRIFVVRAESNRALVKRVYESLDAPGIVIIVDLLPNEERTAPPFSLIFSLNMLIHTDKGDTYTEYEIKEFLEDAGFSEMATIRFDPAPLGVITALKKS